ncbi:MAG: putative rane spanning protein [Burkholderiales bacterium]|jgi:hypothetical protein|nr:putative rane spanning protein [Burkholderiales bacterium]
MELEVVSIFLNRVRTYAANNPLLIFFILVSIWVRLIFWFYSGRVWEDALITLAPARNAWLGNGLTHHLSEARIHSFTSPISVLIPLIGEAFHQGLFALRFSSVVASIFTIYYAYRIGKIFNLHWSAQILLLGYLSMDWLQIFFGMAGMETQVATAIFIATFYYLFIKKWKLLGILAGFGMLVRPEFLFCILVIGLYMLVWHKRSLPKVIVGFACVAIPWYLFAFFYYGSIVPNTIIAKSVGNHFGPFKNSIPVVCSYLLESWKNMAPFVEWFFTRNIPVPMFFIKLVVCIVLLLFILGVIRAFIVKEWQVLVLAAVFILFVAYRSDSTLSIYYMWYLPPFLALLFIVSAFGLSYIPTKINYISAVISVYVVILYSLHTILSLPSEKQIQDKIECGVRFKIGVILNSMMSITDTVIMEPLGYIGYGAFNKTTYDFPGLSSKTVVHKIAQMKGGNILEIIKALNPSFIVLRPQEFKNLVNTYPDVAKQYVFVSDIKADETDFPTFGYSETNFFSDGEFTIFRRSDRLVNAPKPQDMDKLLKSADYYGICENSN